MVTFGTTWMQWPNIFCVLYYLSLCMHIPWTAVRDLSSGGNFGVTLHERKSLRTYRTMIECDYSSLSVSGCVDYINSKCARFFTAPLSLVFNWLWPPGMKNTVRPPLLLRLLLAAILATIAHALPSRPSGLHEDDRSGLVEDGLDVEQGFLPPAPSEALIEKMKMHNTAFDYQYAFWNFTNLDYNSCHKITEQLNQDILAPRQTDGLCTFTYSCNFDSLRYPRWLIFTNCSSGDRCDPERRSARCFSYEDDVLMLIYVKSDGRPRSTRSTGGDNAATTSTTEQVTQENGEWKLWFVQVPSECKCSVWTLSDSRIIFFNTVILYAIMQVAIGHITINKYKLCNIRHKFWAEMTSLKQV